MDTGLVPITVIRQSEDLSFAPLVIEAKAVTQILGVNFENCAALV